MYVQRYAKTQVDTSDCNLLCIMKSRMYPFIFSKCTSNKYLCEIENIEVLSIRHQWTNEVGSGT